MIMGAIGTQLIDIEEKRRKNMKYEIKTLSIIDGTEKTIAVLWDKKSAFEYAETLKAQAFVSVYENGEWIGNI